MNKKKAVFRGIRKAAYVSRRLTGKASTLSGMIENKAGRIVSGTDPTIQIYKKILQEQIMSDGLPEITPLHPAMPYTDRHAAVNLLIPSLQNSSFFGGTATALIVAAKLAKKRNIDLRVIETLKEGKSDTAQLHAFFTAADIELSIERISLMSVAGRKFDHYGYLDIRPDDLFVASAWWDAHILNELPLLTKFVYLIQDFEPIFYNNSDHYISAEETYRTPSFVPLCNTALMAKFMHGRGYAGIPAKPLSFEPAVNIGAQRGYAVKKKAGEKRRLFLYGRPSVHRNLFYRALTTIDRAFADNILVADEWEVFMAGQDGLADILLDCGVTIQALGKMTLDEYYDFAKTIDLGVSLMMAPHPSYPPLELASLGAAVVTTKYETKQDLAMYSGNLIVTDTSQKALLAGITTAAGMSHEVRKAQARAMQLPTDWHAALDTSIAALDSLL